MPAGAFACLCVAGRRGQVVRRGNHRAVRALYYRLRCKRRRQVCGHFRRRVCRFVGFGEATHREASGSGQQRRPLPSGKQPLCTGAPSHGLYFLWYDEKQLCVLYLRPLFGETVDLENRTRKVAQAFFYSLLRVVDGARRYYPPVEKQRAGGRHVGWPHGNHFGAHRPECQRQPAGAERAYALRVGLEECGLPAQDSLRGLLNRTPRFIFTATASSRFPRRLRRISRTNASNMATRISTMPISPRTTA